MISFRIIPNPNLNFDGIIGKHTLNDRWREDNNHSIINIFLDKFQDSYLSYLISMIGS